MNIPLIGCGILKKEVDFLINKNGWDISALYLNSSLHINFNKLEKALNGALQKSCHDHEIVLYGTCHPSMDRFIEENGAVRIRGQNCLEQLLGNELFHYYLSKGAFFLLEEWAHRWDAVMAEAFGDNQSVIREILGGEQKYFLALKTACTGEYNRQAQEISQKTGLPLLWLDVSLDHLEQVLQEGINEWVNLYG